MIFLSHLVMIIYNFLAAATLELTIRQTLNIVELIKLNFNYIADKNPYLMVVLGDFNVKLNSWHTNGSRDIKESKIDILTSSFGFHEISNKATHI